MTTRQIKKMSWGDQYVTPEIKTLEIKSEGLLCASGVILLDRADAGYDSFNDLGEI